MHYFFEKTSAAAFRDRVTCDTTFRELGMPHLCGGWKFAQTPIDKGPNGLSGMVLCGANEIGKRAYDDTAQEWQQISERVFIGRAIGSPLTPESVARPRQYDGRPIEIDGYKWIVPIASALPKRFAYSPDGQVIFQPDSRFTALTEFAKEIIDDSKQSTWAEFLTGFGLMLSTNYFISEKEIVFASEVSTDLLLESFAILLDSDQKKTGSD